MQIDALRNLYPTGIKGFEGLIAKLLSELTGRKFILSKSGSQHGRDLSMRHFNCNIVAVECKRYGSKTVLNESELLGKIAQALKDIPDLDLWVLVTTKSMNSQLFEALEQQCTLGGISFLSLSNDDEPSSLEILCAQAIKVVTE